MGNKRALSVTEIRSYQPRVVEFQGAWLASIGKPEMKGSWLIWGKSGNGKTSYALQLAAYLARYVKVAYNSVEEGLSLTMQKAIERVNMGEESKRNFTLLDKESIEDLMKRLKQQRSAKVIFIDSLQHSQMSKQQYITLLQTFPNKLFIFVSHAAGTEPAGKVAAFVRYDANVKVYVEGYYANAMSRYGGGERFDVWPEMHK